MTGLVDAQPRDLGGGHRSGPLAFGTWRFTHDSVTGARAVLEAALDADMTLVDTADVYGLDWGGAGFGAVEDLLGRVLADAPALRDRMVLASKGGIVPPVPYDSSQDGLRAACEASLRRLGVERIDLYQIHRADLFAHPAEVATALADLRDEGKIDLVGVSNHTPAQHEALAMHLADAEIAVATTQPEFSAAHVAPLRDGTLDLAMRDDVVPLAWSPLAGGRLLTGNGIATELLDVLDGLAEREGVDRATIAIAFVLAHPSRPVVIVGSQTPERLHAARRAFDVTLDRADLYAVVQASEGRPLP